MASGAGLSHELEALLDAEAVLFVDDDEAEISEVYLLFDESVGADGEVGFAAEDSRSRLTLGARVKRAGEEGDAVGLAGARGEDAREKLAGEEEVLGGEDLGGSHHRGLVAIFDGDQRGLKRDNGLAAADVSLEKAAHGMGGAHVGDNLAEYTLLRFGGLERENLLQSFADFVVGVKGCSDALAETSALEFEA